MNRRVSKLINRAAMSQNKRRRILKRAYYATTADNRSRFLADIQKLAHAAPTGGTK